MRHTLEFIAQNPAGMFIFVLLCLLMLVLLAELVDWVRSWFR